MEINGYTLAAIIIGIFLFLLFFSDKGGNNNGTRGGNTYGTPVPPSQTGVPVPPPIR